MANSADPDQLASKQKPNDLDQHCLQRQSLMTALEINEFNNLLQFLTFLTLLLQNTLPLQTLL